VSVRGVTVDTHGPNNDGCDPECCRDVVIAGCAFDTGDDCIAIKSGKNADGRRVDAASQDIVIRDCTFADGHGGLTIGSEMTGGVRNVFAENLQMSSPNLDIALRLKTNSLRGGFIRNVHLRHATIGQVREQAFGIDFSYGEGPGHGFDPVVEHITVRDVTVGSARQALRLVGYPSGHIRDITLTDCTFAAVTEPSEVQHVDNLVLRRVRTDASRIDSSRIDSSRIDSSRIDSSRTNSSRTNTSRRVPPPPRPAAELGGLRRARTSQYPSSTQTSELGGSFGSGGTR
jgi:polygalacturonase